MKVFILTATEYGDREIVHVAGSREEIHEYIVEQVLSGVTFQEAQISDHEITAPVAEPTIGELGPKEGDYIIDGSGDRWDYFPHMNQYKMRKHITSNEYREDMGFWAGYKIEQRYGIRQNTCL